MPKPEWDEPAEGFRMILRASHTENPDLADQITAKTWLWFRYSHQIEGMAAEAGRGSAARDIVAARAAFDLFHSEYRNGHIRSRGFLNGAAERTDIDPTDAKEGDLSVWKRELDCTSSIAGRIFRNVEIDKTSVRKAISILIGESKPAGSKITKTVARKFVVAYLNSTPHPTMVDCENKWPHGSRGRKLLRTEYHAEAKNRDKPVKEGRPQKLAK